MRLIGRWAFDGVAVLDTRQRLFSAINTVPAPHKDGRWQRRYLDLGSGTALAKVLQDEGVTSKTGRLLNKG